MSAAVAASAFASHMLPPICQLDPVNVALRFMPSPLSVFEPAVVTDMSPSDEAASGLVEYAAVRAKPPQFGESHLMTFAVRVALATATVAAVPVPFN